MTLLVLTAALVSSALIPNSLLYDNMLKSALSYREKDAFSIKGTAYNTIADNYADTILLQISMNIGDGDDPFVGALDTRYYDGGDYGESIGLYLSLTDETVTPNVDYTRYWHGSAMFVRLLHLFTDVDGIKLIGFTAALLLAALTAAILIKHRHPDLAAAFILSLISVHIWNIRLSLEYLPAFIIGVAMCALYLLLERRGDAYLPCLAVIGGVTVAFFDFLTNETVTVLLPLILVIAVRAREERLGDFRENLFLIIKCGIGWLASYAATFLAKWILASAVTGENRIAWAFSAAGERIAGDTSLEGVDNALARVFIAPLANISTLFGGTSRFDPAYAALGLFVTAAVVITVVYLFGRKPYAVSATLLLTLLGAVVLVRYAALSNHSYLHEFFTYRALISPIMALYCAILLNIRLPRRKQSKK